VGEGRGTRGFLTRHWRSPVLENLAARIAALVSLGLATLLVARVNGPAGVGVYALLRVLPGLAGVVLSAGLPGAVAFFLSGPARSDRRLPLTLLSMAAVAGTVGAALWALAAPVLTHVFFRGVSSALVATAGLIVLTKLLVATSKSASQGSGDLHGSNRIIVLEELTFLAVYVVVVGVGARGIFAIVAGLILADLGTGLVGWARLSRRDFFKSVGRPSLSLARRVASFGVRGQVGGVIALLNLRLDFAILGALAGPATLGTYAVASKYAELVRLLPLAIFWVFYPRYATDGHRVAARRAGQLIPRSGALVAAGILPLALGAIFLIPALFGPAFTAAILPAQILLIGLAGEGVGGVITAFLYGTGRPGLNSLAYGAGLVGTVGLDLLLIPRYGAIGAAIASSVAYLTTTALLVTIFWLVTRARQVSRAAPGLSEVG
jgi:O-antigen/teichoic acid export membrane protein